MTKRLGLLTCAWLGLLATAAPAQNEGLQSDSGTDLSAQVTIPYQEFKRLLDAAEIAAKAEDSPDIAGAVTRAQIKLSLDLQHPSGEAEFDINTFGHRWVFIPFAGLDLPITNVACENGTIVPRNGLLCLVTNRSGQSKVVLDFDIPFSLVTGAGDSISLRLVPTAAVQLEFGNVPAGKRIMVNGRVADTNRPLPVSVAGGEIKITCVGDNPESPTVWSQITQTLVKPALEAVEVESHIHLSSHSGAGLSAETELPMTASKLEIDGADLQPAQIGMSESGHRRITLNWETAGILDRNIVVRYQLPSAEPGRSWEIQNPRFGEELSPQTCLTVITPLPGSAVQSDDGQTGSDVTQLPHWIQLKLVTPEFYVIHAVSSATVSTRLLPVLKPDNARISTVAYQTTLVPDGSLKCEALFKIEYRSTFSWGFRLPEGSTLLDCQMNSAPASPVVKTDGQLELSIPAPADSGRFNSLQISIIYTARSAKFEPVEGKLNLSLPSTQLFIEQLEWRLYLPDNYEATAFEGNVEPAPEDNTTIVFKKRLLRGETPSLEVYYGRKPGSQVTP
jgi:hypothetical protein